jgi:saccharopine dehydrogenase (NAD+, L-lysine-forming)
MNKKQSLCSKRRLLLIKKATHAELILKAYLDFLNINYMFQKGFIAGNGFYIVDFYIPKPFKICIEVDGTYHNFEAQKEQDEIRTKYLIKRGFKVVRFTNKEIYKNSINQIKDKIFL